MVQTRKEPLNLSYWWIRSFIEKTITAFGTLFFTFEEIVALSLSCSITKDAQRSNIKFNTTQFVIRKRGSGHSQTMVIFCSVVYLYKSGCNVHYFRFKVLFSLQMCSTETPDFNIKRRELNHLLVFTCSRLKERVSFPVR